MMGTVSATAGGDGEVEPTGVELADAFGAAWPRIQRYHEMLATEGEVRGLVGPREVGRLWSRHIVNCAAICSLIPPGARVADLGSGAGLPGVVVACLRPEDPVVLIEPMARRVSWLAECVRNLGLTNVEIRHARAEELAAEFEADIVTARAVAGLDKLVALAVPLLSGGGALLAIKGSQAAIEVERARKALARAGAMAEVRACSMIPSVPATTVVRVALR